MAKLIAMYKTPADAAAFDRYYHATHVPIARKRAGTRELRDYARSDRDAGRPAPYHLIAMLDVRFGGGDPGGARVARGPGHGRGPRQLRDRAASTSTSPIP